MTTTVVLDEGDLLLREAGQLCEGPLWDERDNRLLWVDVPAGAVHATDLGTGEDRVVLRDSGPVGCVALRASGGHLVARRSGVAGVEPGWGRCSDLASLPGQQPRTRTNDGGCDPWGGFWVGTLATDDRPGAGGLWRLEPDGAVRPALDGVSVSNGLDWSPDGSQMYYVDSPTGRIDLLDLDPDDRSVRSRSPLVSLGLPGAVPDGLTVDAEGFLWVAVWDGARVRRYDPAGRLDRELLLPVDRVTSIAFGGPALDVLVVTTAWDGLSPSARAAQPLAGSLFVHDPGVRGRRAGSWAG
ncbi:MAG: SMP-30/gluconolactonase/LRE family protein [Sporichthyaceae bacterium]